MGHYIEEPGGMCVDSVDMKSFLRQFVSSRLVPRPSLS